jgi:hypothetical protein
VNEFTRRFDERSTRLHPRHDVQQRDAGSLRIATVCSMFVERRVPHERQAEATP